MQGPANSFTADPNMLAQITGKGNIPLVALPSASLPYNVGGTTLVDETAGIFQQLTTGAGNTTLNTVTVGKPGQLLIIEIANDAGGPRTITLGANIRGQGNIVGTASKSFILALVSNGVKWMEMFRSSAAIT